MGIDKARLHPPRIDFGVKQEPAEETGVGLDGPNPARTGSLSQLPQSQTPFRRVNNQLRDHGIIERRNHAAFLDAAINTRQTIRHTEICQRPRARRSEEHTSVLLSLMRNSSAVFCLNKKNPNIVCT